MRRVLVSLSSIVERIFTLADPLGSTSNVGWGGGPSLTSFESYKATRDRLLAPVPMSSGTPATRVEPTESELRSQYEALRADQLAFLRHDARRDLTSSALLFLVAAGLFVGHWRWVRGAEVRALAARAALSADTD